MASPFDSVNDAWNSAVWYWIDWVGWSLVAQGWSKCTWFIRGLGILKETWCPFPAGELEALATWACGRWIDGPRSQWRWKWRGDISGWAEPMLWKMAYFALWVDKTYWVPEGHLGDQRRARNVFRALVGAAYGSVKWLSVPAQEWLT